MKRELRNQFNRTKKTLKSKSQVKDAFDEMFNLMEMVVNYVDEKTMRSKKKVINVER